MKDNIRALFYDYKYYLLPDSHKSAKELPTGVELSLCRLCEELCMAPDFIEESIRDEVLVIEDIDRVFDISVRLYTSAEYDALLRPVVDRVCPGCQRFGDDGSDDLTGHHRELSLSGCCYEREPEDCEPSLARWMTYYWEQIGERADKIELCIDKNDCKGLQEIFDDTVLFNLLTDLEVAGKNENGVYHLYFSILGWRSEMIGVIKFLTGFTENYECEVKRRGWILHCGFEAGISTFQSRTLKEKTRRFAISESEDVLGFDIAIVDPDYEKWEDDERYELQDELHRVLCAALGEDCVIYLVNYLTYSDTAEETLGFEELCAVLEMSYREALLSKLPEGASIPMPVLTPYSIHEDDKPEKGFYLPFKELTVEGATTLPNVSFTTSEEWQNGQVPEWTALFTYTYFFIPCDTSERSPKEIDTLMWYLSHGDLIPAPIRDPEDAFSCGYGIGSCHCGKHGYIVESAIYDEQKFFGQLRCMAPVLLSLGAKLVVANRSGVKVYDCGYEFKECQI